MSDVASRLSEIANRDEAKVVSVRTDDLRSILNSHDQLIEALEKWKAYDDLLRSLPRVGPIYGGQLEHVDAAYDDCIAATIVILSQARKDTP